MENYDLRLEKVSDLHDLFREVSQLHSALATIQGQVHEKIGLSTSSLKVMKTLIKKGPNTVPHIGSHLGLSRQFVQTICNEIIKRGFVESRPNPFHKKSRLMQLTDQGRNAFYLAQEIEFRIIESALQNIETSSSKVVTELLSEIRKTFETYIETLP